MSIRRFAAYFFAIAAGSTVAFASSLMGQPAPADAAMTGAAMTEKGMILTPTDAGLDVLPPATVRMFQQHWDRSRHKSAPEIAQIALAK